VNLYSVYHLAKPLMLLYSVYSLQLSGLGAPGTETSAVVRIRIHRRTSQGAGGAAAPPQTRAKPLFFGQKLNFVGRSQQPKMKNN